METGRSFKADGHLPQTSWMQDKSALYDLFKLETKLFTGCHYYYLLF